MRRALAAVFVALVAAAPATGAPPQVAAKAYLVENGATGEVLAGERSNVRLPIASI